MRRHRPPASKGIGYRGIAQLIVIIGLPIAISLLLSNIIITQMQLPKILFLFLFPLLFLSMIAGGVGIVHLVRWFGKPTSSGESGTDAVPSPGSSSDHNGDGEGHR